MSEERNPTSRKTLKLNCYNAAAFNRAMNKKQKNYRKKETVGLAPLPFQQSISYKISRLLGKFGIKRVHIPAKKSSHIRRTAKDDLGLNV
jgi:hypothetical protein